MRRGAVIRELAAEAGFFMALVGVALVALGSMLVNRAER